LPGGANLKWRGKAGSGRSEHALFKSQCVNSQQQCGNDSAAFIRQTDSHPGQRAVRPNKSSLRANLIDFTIPAGETVAQMPSLIFIWIWLCAYLNSVGWVLSALHQLNAGGYAVALALGVAILLVWRKRCATPFFPEFRWLKLHRRFRRKFPMAFLALLALAFLGGALYGPNNYDAMAYRIPRVLNWLAADQWHWIHTIFPRLNNRVCGDEWVTAPLIVFTNTDRLLFLINIVSFILLPGLVFSVFTRLGMRPRVAWYWMWLVPSGYCFVLQAGSNGNDLFGTVFTLAAVDFALRAKSSQSPVDFFTAVVVAAMMTSAKISNLPLLLPCAVALWFSWKLVFRYPLKTVCVSLFALSASALPTMVFNEIHFGNFLWPEMNRSYSESHVPLRTTANLVLITLQNIVPPVFPMAKAWDKTVLAVLSPDLQARLHQTMAERGAAEFQLPETQIEESAGLGFGLSFFLPISFIAAWFLHRNRSRHIRDYRTLLRWLLVAVFLTVMTQGGLTGVARLMAPFYPLIMPVLLTGEGHGVLVRKAWWRAGAFAVFACAAFLLIISPSRPLFPAMTMLERFPRLPERVRTVYSVYHDRTDAFAPVRALLPPETQILGFISYDDPEAALWRPFGTRLIKHVCPQDTPDDLKKRGIVYVLVNAEKVPTLFNLTPEEWIKQMNAQIAQRIPLTLRAGSGPREWLLVKLN
jgi:hypothetical protein